ncbi:uncharacterized protein LOC141906928 isoform X2 [Tubulanus polymorphus]|uniref:uncharacterized protein LOC141906928 isoform X2 n=1 Tax=Tubulanus polymorphus TaxID=672921 RepID=UPI003DA2316F
MQKSDQKCVGVALNEKNRFEARADDAAKKWFSISEVRMEQHEQVIRQLAFGPFICGLGGLGSGLHTNKFMNWMIQTNYPFPRSNNYEDEAFDEREDASLNELEIIMKTLNDKMKKQRHDYLRRVISLITQMKDVDDIEQALSFAKKGELFSKEDMEMLQNADNKRIYTGGLFIADLYVEHVTNLTWKNQDSISEFRHRLESKEKESQAENILGNTAFREGNYNKAIQHYTNAAIISPYSYTYYGNRAQCYLRINNGLRASIDGRRCITLNPYWTKGVYRYCQALVKLKRFDLALKVNEEAVSRFTIRSRDMEKSGISLSDLQELEKLKAFINKEKCKEDYTREKLLKIGIDIGENSSKNKDDDVATGSSDEEDDDVPELISDSDEDSLGNVKQAAVSDVSDDEEPPNLVSDDDFDVECIDIDDNSDRNKENRCGNKTQSRHHRDSYNNQRPKFQPSMKINDINQNVDKPKKKESTEKPPPEPVVKLLPEEERRHLFNEYLKEGSLALLEQRNQSAYASFTKALEMIAQDSYQFYKLLQMDVMIVKYSLSTSAIGIGEIHYYKDGIQGFKNIISEYKDIYFPLAYYGIGRGYRKLNRFFDALDPLKKGLRLLKRLEKISIRNWPGTKHVIEETKPGILQERLLTLYNECQYPAPPDAICRYCDCAGNSNMYFTDPDFNGFVHVTCNYKCTIDYHTNCWRCMRRLLPDKPTDKDFLLRECLTPDCQGVIVRVAYCDADRQWNRLKEQCANPPLKQTTTSKRKFKMQVSSKKRIDKQAAKKLLKKQKKEEARNHGDAAKSINCDDELLSTLEKVGKEAVAGGGGDVESLAEESISLPGDDDKLLIDEPMTLLKKDVDADDVLFRSSAKQGSSKSKKKKKDKSKKTITIEQVLPERPNLSGAGDGNQPNFPDEQSLASSTTELSETETNRAIKENIYTFFIDYFTANGPIVATSPKLQQFVNECFPEEAKKLVMDKGGIAKFLMQNLKFAMIEDVLCLVKDAMQGRKIANERKYGNAMTSSASYHGDVTSSVHYLWNDNFARTESNLMASRSHSNSVASLKSDTSEGKQSARSSSGELHMKPCSTPAPIVDSTLHYSDVASSSVSNSYADIGKLDDFTLPPSALQQSTKSDLGGIGLDDFALPPPLGVLDSDYTLPPPVANWSTADTPSTRSQKDVSQSLVGDTTMTQSGKRGSHHDVVVLDSDVWSTPDIGNLQDEIQRNVIGSGRMNRTASPASTSSGISDNGLLFGAMKSNKKSKKKNPSDNKNTEPKKPSSICSDSSHSEIASPVRNSLIKDSGLLFGIKPNKINNSELKSKSKSEAAFETEPILTSDSFMTPEQSAYVQQTECDEKYIRDLTESLTAELETRPTFLNNPNLRENIEQQIRSDLYRSGRTSLDVSSDDISRSSLTNTEQAIPSCVAEVSVQCGGSSVDYVSCSVQTDEMVDHIEKEALKRQLNELLNQYSTLQFDSILQQKQSKELVDRFQEEQKKSIALEELNHKQLVEMEVLRTLNSSTQQQFEDLKRQCQAVLKDQECKQKENTRMMVDFIREQQRARDAEVALLEMRKTIGFQNLSRSLHDTERYILKIRKIIECYELYRREVPTEVFDCLRQWTETKEIIAETINTTIKLKFPEWINVVKNGAHLSMFPEANILPLPPPKPSLLPKNLDIFQQSGVVPPSLPTDSDESSRSTPPLMPTPSAAGGIEMSSSANSSNSPSPIPSQPIQPKLMNGRSRRRGDKSNSTMDSGLVQPNTVRQPTTSGVAASVRVTGATAMTAPPPGLSAPPGSAASLMFPNQPKKQPMQKKGNFDRIVAAIELK